MSHSTSRSALPNFSACAAVGIDYRRLRPYAKSGHGVCDGKIDSAGLKLLASFTSAPLTDLPKTADGTARGTTPDGQWGKDPPYNATQEQL